MKIKRILSVFLALILTLGLAACGGGTDEAAETAENISAGETQETQASSVNEETEETQASSADEETEETQASSAEEGTAGTQSTAEGGSHILIAYFSMPEDVDPEGADAVAGASIVVDNGEIMGNVEYMAGIIQDTVGGDLFRIETVQQYPLDHETLVDQAAEEQDADARPELSTHIENLDQYDTIILGYPNWWGDMPQALYTFLEEYDFSGKTIIPFCPHGGSGFSRTESTIAELQPGATVSENGLAISRNDVAGSAQEIASWAEGLGLN